MDNVQIKGQKFQGFDGIIPSDDQSTWKPDSITSQFLTDLNESGSSLTDQLNRLESELVRDDLKTDVLKAQLLDLKCLLKNDTTKCEYLKTALQETSKQLKALEQRDPQVKTPSHALRHICGKIIESGIDDLDEEELKFMHEEVYCAAHRINSDRTGDQFISELANLSRKVEGLNRELQLVLHLFKCRETRKIC